MKGFSFPIVKTKIEGVKEKFQLEDPTERRKYFNLKAGREIEKIRDYLAKGNTFVCFLLGPKNSGKGTYTKLFMEAVGGEHVAHVSVGDVVRNAHKILEGEEGKEEFVEYLKSRYRGFVSVESVLDIILGRDTKTLLPTEVALTLLEKEIARIGRKAVFIDGFPRNLDQISYSLFFRTLIGYRDDPDFFVFIDVPEAIIDERMKQRAVCPKCQTPRGLKLLRTKEVGYDKEKKEFYLICDNPQCSGFGKTRLVSKEGDSLGIEAVRERVEMDIEVMKKLSALQGVPKIHLRNSVPVNVAEEYVDDYEVSLACRYEFDEKENKVKVIEEPWAVKDEDGVEVYGLLPPPMTVSLIKQISRVLEL